MRASKKFAGCIWGQKVTAAGVADGPIFRMGNAYPLSFAQSVVPYDQLSAQCDTAGQILETRNELEANSGEITLYQYGATEIGWALGAAPVAMTGAGGTVSPTDVTAPAAGEWIETGQKNLATFVLTNSAGDVTYVAGIHYLVNMSLGVWTPIAGGSGYIAKDAVLKWSGTYSAPTGYRLDAGTVLQNYVRMFGVIQDLKTGNKVQFNLKCVSLTAKNGVVLISDPKTEYEPLSFDLKLITPPGHTTPAVFEGVTAD